MKVQHKVCNGHPGTKNGLRVVTVPPQIHVQLPGFKGKRGFPDPGLKMKRKSYCLITTAVTSIKCYLKVNGLHMLKTLELLTDHCKEVTTAGNGLTNSSSREGSSPKVNLLVSSSTVILGLLCPRLVNPVDHVMSVSQLAFSTRAWLSLQKEKIYGCCCSLEKNEATEKPLSPDLSWANINEGGVQDLAPLTDTPFTILWFPPSDLAPILVYVSHSMLDGNLGFGVDVVDWMV
ncbi:hypothetical protein HGM15179_002398 [Zosterops borbonicus]|uniref:Uncharacterized protein n=1 Tax=Zosterops borbonicus TaxID=364589 RepID=A0A8K1GSX2_9PASS|nr:hypothetical protein HGM15179_002398 [Zosterops borbonicus]